MYLLLEPGEVFLPTCKICWQLHYRTLKVRYMHYSSKKKNRVSGSIKSNLQFMLIVSSVP